MRNIRQAIVVLSAALLFPVKGQPLTVSTSTANLTSTTTSTTTVTSSAQASSEIASESSLSTRIEELKSYAETASTTPFASPTATAIYLLSGRGCPGGIKVGDLCCYGDVIEGKCIGNRPQDSYIDFVGPNQTVEIDDFGGQWFDSNMDLRLSNQDIDDRSNSAQIVAQRSSVLLGFLGAVAILGGWF